jgi:GNAT superfamily N-acetyltransferase
MAGIPTALLEQVEAETYADWEAAAPAAALAALGTQQLRIGGGVAMAVPNDASGFWTKTVGLGFTEPITTQLLEQVTEFYREQGISATRLQLAPDVLPADWADICAKLNIHDSGSAWVKLAGDIDTVVRRSAAGAHLDAGLRVERVTAERAREFAELTWEVFGLPAEHQVEMGVGVVGRPGWSSFAVLEGSKIVAAGSVYAFQNVGNLFGGATLPGARRRGAQSALIAARASAAQEAGCTWMIGETGAQRAGQHNESLHNMHRAGLSVRYQRQNWVWRDPSRQ